MPIHDWTRVRSDIFHDLHLAWAVHLSEGISKSLPAGYYAMTESHFARSVGEVIPATRSPAWSDYTSATLLRRRKTHWTAIRRRTVTIRRCSDHHIVALIEIVSPANKYRAGSVREFVAKAVDALRHGMHLLVVDLFASGRHDPHGLPALIWKRWTRRTFRVPADRPLTLAAFVAARRAEVYVEHVAPGAAMPDMPVFLSPDHSIYAPLEASYMAAYRGVPEFWREVVEGRREANGA